VRATASDYEFGRVEQRAPRLVAVDAWTGHLTIITGRCYVTP
jgi:hypothetical protein